VRVYSFAEAAVRCGVTPREIRLLVEERRLRASRRAGTRVIEEAELERAGLLDADTCTDDTDVAPPLAVVLERLEEKAAELAAVRQQLADAESRHAAEVKALRREVHDLHERARSDPSSRDSKGGMRPSLRALFGEGMGDEDSPPAPPGR
jgi:DNA-binding transcriptional MerR regulator